MVYAHRGTEHGLSVSLTDTERERRRNPKLVQEHSIKGFPMAPQIKISLAQMHIMQIRSLSPVLYLSLVGL
jgi:hypothetical protein